jgi:hypothetical protein
LLEATRLSIRASYDSRPVSFEDGLTVVTTQQQTQTFVKITNGNTFLCGIC